MSIQEKTKGGMSEMFMEKMGMNKKEKDILDKCKRCRRLVNIKELIGTDGICESCVRGKEKRTRDGNKRVSP